MIGFISFVLIFSLLIFVHELGHFVTAKLAGVYVEEFGFGYPPRLLTLGTWRGTKITLNALPFGGFVRMNEDDPSVVNSLANRSRAVRVLVFSAGSLMNLLLAIVLYSTIYLVGALTPVEQPGAGVYYVAPGSPAMDAGIVPGDTIVAIDSEPVDDVDEAVALIRDNLGEPVEIQLRRNSRLVEPVVATPRENPPENEGALGVALDRPLERQSYPIWEAVPLGLRATVNTVEGIYLSLRSAIAGETPFQLSGPIGIYQHTVQVSKSGIEQLIELTAMLSVNLFLLNLLPLPALDGGRLIFVLVEVVRGGRRVPAEKEGLVHLVGMILLIGLMLVITYGDIRRLIG